MEEISNYVLLSSGNDICLVIEDKAWEVDFVTSSARVSGESIVIDFGFYCLVKLNLLISKIDMAAVISAGEFTLALSGQDEIRSSFLFSIDH
jgi:hypothetical protein